MKYLEMFSGDGVNIKMKLVVAACATLLIGAPAEIARADIVFDFSATCDSGCVGTATGVLTLSDNYVYGTSIDSEFVSLQYTSSDENFTLSHSNPPLTLLGGINADGSVIANPFFVIKTNIAPNFAITSNNNVLVFDAFDTLRHVDESSSFAFTNVSSVPEPSTWAMMIVGFAGIGAMTYRRRRAAGSFT